MLPLSKYQLYQSPMRRGSDYYHSLFFQLLQAQEDLNQFFQRVDNDWQNCLSDVARYNNYYNSHSSLTSSLDFEPCDEFDALIIIPSIKKMSNLYSYWRSGRIKICGCGHVWIPHVYPGSQSSARDAALLTGIGER